MLIEQLQAEMKFLRAAQASVAKGHGDVDTTAADSSGRKGQVEDRDVRVDTADASKSEKGRRRDRTTCQFSSQLPCLLPLTILSVLCLVD